MRLVVRVKVKPVALWQYMGQYDVQPSDPLSLQEWTMQSEQVRLRYPFIVTVVDAPKTKKEWVKCIYDKDWGGSVRARIKFRKSEGRNPTEDEEDGQNTPGLGEVTAVEIRQALDKGEQVSFAWSLTFDP